MFTFVIQVITGFFLWTAYSPSTQTAWESVFFIQYQMQLGWLIRGLHHYASQAMIILLALHILQVVIAGAYRPPREVNWWLGLLLTFVVLGLALTGYLLPWDEKGYWATQVATKIMGVVPMVGPALQQLLIGGPNYGHHTLTRFFALHAGLLPALLIVLLAAHIALFRRHGVTHPRDAVGETTGHGRLPGTSHNFDFSRGLGRIRKRSGVWTRGRRLASGSGRSFGALCCRPSGVVFPLSLPALEILSRRE